MKINSLPLYDNLITFGEMLFSMHYFVITFNAFIDSQPMITGTIGIVSETAVYKQNIAKAIAKEFYKQRFRDAKSISIAIVDAMQYEKHEYEKRASDFITNK